MVVPKKPQFLNMDEARFKRLRQIILDSTEYISDGRRECFETCATPLAYCEMKFAYEWRWTRGKAIGRLTRPKKRFRPIQANATGYKTSLEHYFAN